MGMLRSRALALAFFVAAAVSVAAVPAAHAASLSTEIDNALKAGKLTSGAANALKTVLRASSRLGSLSLGNVQSGNGAITGDVSFMNMNWTLLAYSGGNTRTTFMAFGPKKIFRFQDIIKKVPGIELLDVIKFSDLMLTFSPDDAEMDSGSLPANVRAMTDKFFEKKDYSLVVPAGVAQYGNFDLGAAKPLADAIKFLGGQSSKVFTRASFGGNIIDALLSGSPPEAQVALAAALPTFRPSIGGKITMPADVQFSLFATLKPQQKEATLGYAGTTLFRIGKQDVNMVLDTQIKQTTGAPEISLTATVFQGIPWKQAFGIPWLTIEDYRMTFGQEADTVKVGIGGKTSIGSKQFDVFTLAAVAAKTVGIPIPERIELAVNDGPNKIGQIGLKDMASIYLAMINAVGKKNLRIPKEFPDVAIAGTKVGEGPKIAMALKASGEAGIDMSGALRILDTNIATVERAFIQADQGIEIKAKTANLGVGPIKFPTADVDVVARADAEGREIPPPQVLIKTTGLSLFGSKSEMELTMKLTQFELKALQNFGTLFKFNFLATTGEEIDSMEHLANADLRLNASLSSDPGEWIRTSGKKAVEAAFAVISKDVDAATADLKKAQADVASLDKQIAAMKAQVEKERAEPAKQLKAAEDEVNKLNRDIASLDSQISTIKGRIHSCNQNKSVCLLSKPVKTGCHKKILGKCVIPKVEMECVKRETLPDLPARAVCQANNVKPAAELAAKETAKGTLIASRTVAAKTLEGLRKGITNIPLELDPRVSGLIVARESAMLALKAAEETVKGFGEFTKLLTAGINAVGKPDVFALEKSSIEGSMRGSIEGKPVVLAMNFRLLGQRYGDRFAFSLTDWNFNAKQFEVLALAAATKTVIAAGKQAKVIPHKLLDKVNDIYAKKDREVDEALAKALADNHVGTPEKKTISSPGDVIAYDTYQRLQKKTAEDKAEADVEKKKKDTEATAKVAKLDAAAQWRQLDGAAYDVGVGGGGHAWVIGTNAEGGGYGIYRRNGNAWAKIAGSAVRIDVDPKGNAWVVNKQNEIFRFDGKQWVKMPGAAVDVGVGAGGHVWVVGTNAEGGGYGIYRWDGKNWVKVPGSAMRIDVDPKGNPWVVNKQGNIYRYDGKAWQQMPGAAVDVGIGADGTVWVVGTNKVGGGYGVYRWDGRAWQTTPGGLVNVSVDPKGKPWGVNDKASIYSMN